MKKTAVIGVVIVAIILIIIGVSRGSRDTNTINIAFIGPLTGDGAVWGEIEKNTIALAVDEINASGGVKGRIINVAYEDGKCEGPTALSAAKKLVEINKIKFLLVSCSQEILHIAPYANTNKIVAFTSYASA